MTKVFNRMVDIVESLESVDDDYLAWCANILQDYRRIFVVGNGGSFANADHLVLHLRDVGLDAVNLLGDLSTLTALSNDEGYHNVILERLKKESSKKDALIVFSGSGTSDNILVGVKYANSIGMPVIGFLGNASQKTDVKGGYVNQFCDYSIVVESRNYSVIEDIHSILIHLIYEELKNP